jgi:hypothetical protein
MWQFVGRLTKGWQLSRKNYFLWQGAGTLRLPFDQPYINQRLFGYGDIYLRGLENYVIDGVAGALSKQTLRRQIFKFNIPTYIKSQSHDHIPISIYAHIFGDAGYSYNRNFTDNSLVNQFLYSYGAGIDFVTFYDFNLRVDYCVNQLNQKGLFLHIKGDF